MRPPVVADILPDMPNDHDIRNRGRTGTTAITVDIPADQLAAIDDWIEEDGGRFDRAEAIRALANHALGRTVASRGVKTLPPRLRSLDEIDQQR